MKALFQKDLKENLKVAVIGLLIFSVILLRAYQECSSALTDLISRGSGGQAGLFQPLLATNLLVETAFLFALYGAVLGWLQTRNEAHRDLWAFLIHRPATRTDIFLGKTIAGLCLYSLATGLPLAILVAVVRVPGHIAAPFEWAMVLPLVSIFLMGVVFYFAGLLTGLRQARWFVSRTFGLGLAIIGAMGVFTMPEFWQSLIVIIVTVGLLAAAAWGSYQSGGFYRGQPIAGRLALVVVMVGGCGVALFAGLGLFFTLIVDPLTNHSYTYSNYQMTRDGVIYKETTRDNEMVELVDLDGHPLLDPVTGQKINAKEFQNRRAYGGNLFNSLGRPPVRRNALEDITRFFALINVTDKTLWYLDRHGRLIGYDGRTRKFIGSLDPRGEDGAAAAEPYLQQPNRFYYYNSYNDVTVKLLPTAKAVYRVDFKERSVTQVFSLPNDDDIGASTEQLIGYNENPVHAFLVATRKTVCLMDYQGKTLFSVPYQPDYLKYPQLQFSYLQPTKTVTNRFALWFTPDSETNRLAGWKLPIHVVWLGPELMVTKTVDLPTLQSPDYESWTDKVVATLLPAALHLAMDHKPTSVWNLASFGLTLIFTGTGWWLAARYNFSVRARFGWTVFIFLLGTIGLLAMLCAEEWPRRVPCPRCKKLRVIERESCEHCGSAFLPPEKNGTEIFEPLVKA
jgi:hypothetical protein